MSLSRGTRQDILNTRPARESLLPGTGMGANAVAIHSTSTESAPWKIRRLDLGVGLDGGANSASGYGTWGPSQADGSIDAVFSLDADYAGSAVAPFINGGSRHAGVGLRFTDTGNMAVLAMISVTAGTFQIIDKVGGAEHVLIDRAVAGGFTYGRKYRFVVTVTGTSCTVTLYDMAGTQLDTETFTLTTGTPSAGFPQIHIFDCKMTLHSVKVLDGSGNVISQGPPLFADVAANMRTSNGLLIATGWWDSYSDGTNGSPSSWSNSLTPYKAADFRLTGVVTRKSGRLFGFSFRNSFDGDGYILGYDHNNTAMRLFKGKADTVTLVSGIAVTLALDVDYEFELLVRRSNIRLVFNGVTYTWTDTTYTQAGYLGLVNLSGHHQIKRLDFERLG